MSDILLVDGEVIDQTIRVPRLYLHVRASSNNLCGALMTGNFARLNCGVEIQTRINGAAPSARRNASEL